MTDGQTDGHLAALATA